MSSDRVRGSSLSLASCGVQVGDIAVEVLPHAMPVAAWALVYQTDPVLVPGIALQVIALLHVT